MAEPKAVERTVGSEAHVVIRAPRTLACTRCGATETPKPAGTSLAGVRAFNESVYAWAARHVACKVRP
ncbi:MAG TPA: hypothetical protein VI589_06910 [Vicinamibacteria bacterium]